MIPNILIPCYEQHRHNAGSEELIPAFNYDETIKVVKQLTDEIDALKSILSVAEIATESHA